MIIEKATIEQFDIVKMITHKTINAVYPKYYPEGAVNFFLSHHNCDNILSDIEKEHVYLFKVNHDFVGTVSIKGNEICRLFVLPQWQGQGYGSQIMDFAEKKIFETTETVILDASFSAQEMYLKRGYIQIGYHKICTDNGDYLCYSEMQLYRPQKAFYNGRVFISLVNSENGEVDSNTTFYYHQSNSNVWAEYSGGEIVKGFLVGFIFAGNTLEFTYQHTNIYGKIRIGKCTSYPEILPDGRIQMNETWEWLNGDYSKGESKLIEKL